MFIAMNRFKVRPGHEEDFEKVWAFRESLLDSVPGFRSFHLVRGPSHEDHTLYASHVIWESEEAFREWTRSEAFREAHKNAGQNAHLYVGGPQFEGFQSVDLEAHKASAA